MHSIELCKSIENYKDDPSKLYDKLVLPKAPAIAEEFKPLDRYRRMVKPEHAELSAWYALSRLSDLMLVHCQPLQHTEFFAQLGLEPVAPIEYSPFECEIAVAKNSKDEKGVRLTRVLSPALYFGDLMFCRARVEVIANPDIIDAKTASGSTLFFAYARDAREAQDESNGWGGPEQWQSRMRRDYKYDGKLYYNIDGDFELPQEAEEEVPAGMLTELVVYRSFVKPVAPRIRDIAEPYSYRITLPVHHSLTLRN